MLLKIGSQRTSFSGFGSGYANPLNGTRQSPVIIKALVTLTVQGTATQFQVLRDIFPGCAINQILNRLPVIGSILLQLFRLLRRTRVPHIFNALKKSIDITFLLIYF